MPSTKKILMFAACCFVAACSARPEIVEQVAQPVDVLYRAALNTAIGGEPQAPVPQFEEVERQPPPSELPTRAQIMAHWSFY